MFGKKIVGGIGLMVMAWVGFVSLPTSEVEATPPVGGTPTIVPPGGGTRGGGQVDWGAVINGVMRGMSESGRRQYYPPSQPSTRVYRYPESRRVEPRYVEPRYVEPRRVETRRVEPRYVAPPPAPKVSPKANEVTIKVPTLQSPLEGRVSEISTRCGACYGKELADMAMQSLAGILETLRKDGVEVAAIEKQVEALRLRMAAKDAWRELEPLVRELVDGNPAMQQSGIKEQLEQVIRWLVIRDAFLVLVRSDLRGQGAVVAVAGIPTGLIWVLYDPLLPAGTGLVVNTGLMVCGTGGKGEMHVAQVSAAEGLGLPVAPGDPVPEMEEAEAASLADSLIISVPKDAGASVNYVINGRHEYSVEPGYKQKLPAGQKWVIEFDRGNRQGTARFTLTRGYYEFRIVDNRWDLVKCNFEVTIDNRQGSQDFQYVVNNEVVTVKPGDTKTHSGPDPVIVKFDRGEGPENPARKNLNKSGTYKVAVNTQTNYLDLFAESEPTAKPAADGSG